MKAGYISICVMLCLLLACSDRQARTVEETRTIVLEVIGQQTVFELLSAQHQVDYTRSSRGIFINAIDGLKNEGGHYWRFYINGEPAQTACDKIIAGQDDRIEWRYR